jgi:hypothetical protein
VREGFGPLLLALFHCYSCPNQRGEQSPELLFLPVKEYVLFLP